MTVRNNSNQPRQARVRASVVRVEGGRLTPVQVARPGDELVLVVEVRPRGFPGTAGSELAVEICRGDEVRDRWRQTLPDLEGLGRFALRLHWSDRPGASARLTCRVKLDGRVVASPSVLLMAGGADAQGRFDAPAPPGPMSEQTQLSFVRHFEGLLDPNQRPRSGEN